MSEKIIEFNVNYKTEGKEIPINKQTKEILNKIDNIYGIKKCKDTIRNYAVYMALRRDGKINFGTQNILVENASAYDSSKQLTEIIYRILRSEKIIDTSYKYLDREDIRTIKKENEIDEELIIIDSEIIDTRILSYKREIIELMTKFPNKIFILINNDTRESGRDGFANAILGEFVTWTMEIEKITKENKINYIKNVLEENSIKLAKDNTFEDVLSEEPFWKVKDEIINIILECKIENVKEITDNIVKNTLKRAYYRKNIIYGKQQTAMNELSSMIGMKEVKKQIEQILNYITINKRRDKMPMLHMCFLGNPGTGKTTVARIVGKLFAEMQILSEKKNFVEAQRADLIGKYVGHTAPLTKEKVEEANGGVLFIDEAYSIASYIQDEAGRDFGAECIATLMKEMEDKKDSLCVILAGYTKEMENMLKTNPGFESRIQFKINFPDYNEDELYQIFKKSCKEENYKIAGNVKEVLIKYFIKEKKKENFSNARCVRNIFEKIKFEQADRVVKDNKININLITKKDVVNVIERLENLELLESPKRKIGFGG